MWQKPTTYTESAPWKFTNMRQKFSEMKWDLWNIELDGTSIEWELNTIPLVLVQRTILRGEKVEHVLSRSIPNGNYLKIGLSFRLERDNHETDEDVDHEEGEDDDVDEVEHEDNRTIAFLGSHVSFVGVDGNVENPENIDR